MFYNSPQHLFCLYEESMTALKNKSGFSILEVLIVIAVVATVFAVVVPNIGIIGLTEASSKISTLAGDIRGAYDLAVLNGKPYRVGFEFATGRYWLETTDRDDVFIAEEGIERELTEDELAEKAEQFEDELGEYKDLAGTEVQDQETDKTIPPTSPLVANFEKLKPIEWKKADDPEFKGRSLGPYFIIYQMQTEHHTRPIRIQDYLDESRAYLYFFPNGYIERAVIHIGAKAGDYEIDPNEPPYTIITEPYEGIAIVETGFKEVNVLEDQRRP